MRLHSPFEIFCNILISAVHSFAKLLLKYPLLAWVLLHDLSCFLGSQSVSAFLENVAGKMDLSLSPFKFLDNQFLAKYLMIPQVEAQTWHLARTCLSGEAFAYCHSFQNPNLVKLWTEKTPLAYASCILILWGILLDCVRNGPGTRTSWEGKGIRSSSLKTGWGNFPW